MVTLGFSSCPGQDCTFPHPTHTHFHLAPAQVLPGCEEELALAPSQERACCPLLSGQTGLGAAGLHPLNSQHPEAFPGAAILDFQNKSPKDAQMLLREGALLSPDWPLERSPPATLPEISAFLAC